MVQTGDPTGTDISPHYAFLNSFSPGTGKGGSSVWGRKFEDTFRETLKVKDQSMLFAKFIIVNVVTA